MSSPDAYLPLRLIAKLETGSPVSTAQAVSVDTSGVVLFVDISGFTALTERLSQQRGAAGVEQLARLLEEKFGAIVTRIEAWGGEVVTFAGDAVLAWWEAAGPEEQGAAVRRALRASVDIERALDAPIDGTLVRVRQGIAAGELRAMRVGGSPWVAVLDGAAIDALAELDARRPLAAAALTAHAAALSTRPPDDRIAVDEPTAPQRSPVLPPEVLAAYLSPEHRASMETADGARTLRVVTTFLARLGGGASPSLDALHQGISVIQREVSRHRGAFVSACRDDKGMVAVAAFGLPARAVFHPADPARAAVTVRRMLADAGLPVDIGLATGRTFFGAFRVGERLRMDTVGSPMNLAARLMMRGGVWCDAVTARPAREELSVGDVATLRFKGFSEPVTVWRLDDAHGGPPAGVFVGREALLTKIDEALSGSAPPLHVVGEPGIGKSALLREIGRRAVARGCSVIAVTQAPHDTPLGAWGPALRQVLGDPKAPADALVTALGPLAAEAPVLGPILGVRLPETPTTEAMVGFVRTGRAIELLCRLLAPSAGAPQRVLLVDDAHELDERSVELVDALAEAGVHVFTAGRARPVHAAEDRVRTLAALSPTEVARLVRVGLGISEEVSQAEGLLDWLLAGAHGHPQFTVELLADAQERGALELDPAGHVLYFDRAGLAAAAPPESVEAAFAARLDRLPPASVRVLKAAAVVGVEVSRDALAVLVPEAAEDTIEPLIDAGWLRPEGSELRFASPTAHHAVRTLMVRDERRRLHGALAVWLQRDGAPAVEPAVIADHLAESNAPEAAIEALERAWHRAMDAGLPRSAARFAKRALDLDEDRRARGEPGLADAAQARWHLRVAQACRGFGDTGLAVQHLDAAAVALDLRLPETLGQWRRHLLMELLRHWGERLFRVRAEPHDALRASVLNLLSLTAYLRSASAEQLLATAVRAVRLGWRTHSDEAPGVALATSMLTIASSGAVRIADGYREQAWRTAGTDPRERMDARLGRLMLDVAHARWSDAELLLEEALPDLRAARSDTLHAAFLGLFACADVCTGKLERCRKRASEMVELSARESYLQAIGWARNLECSVALQEGDLQLVRRYADEAQTILERRREPDHLVPRAFRAAAAIQAGDLAEANREVAELEPRLKDVLVSVTGIETYAIPVEVHLRSALAGDTTALKRADAAFKLLRVHTRQFPMSTPRLEALTALRRRAAGRTADAAFAQALARAREMGMPLEAEKVTELEGLGARR